MTTLELLSKLHEKGAHLRYPLAFGVPDAKVGLGPGVALRGTRGLPQRLLQVFTDHRARQRQTHICDTLLGSLR